MEGFIRWCEVGERSLLDLQRGDITVDHVIIYTPILYDCRYGESFDGIPKLMKGNVLKTAFALGIILFYEFSIMVSVTQDDRTIRAHTMQRLPSIELNF
jgi:hypothetical protein